MAFLAAIGLGCGTAAAPPVSLALVDQAGLDAEIARHRGKVVVLDCWSTSCPPCVKEFPRLVDLAGRYGDDVVCLSLSFDYEGIGSPEDAVPRVRTFLEAVGAGRVVNLLGREEADSLAKKLDIVSVPVVYVYGPDGGLVRRFDEDDAAKRLGRPFNYDDVEAAVRGAIGR
jgi:thiol-disulfide isomerase/thioredoxin